MALWIARTLQASGCELKQRGTCTRTIQGMGQIGIFTIDGSRCLGLTPCIGLLRLTWKVWRMNFSNLMVDNTRTGIH